MSQKLNIAIFGASGYTGAEAIRLALGHPGVEIAALTGESKAGQPIDAVYPHLAGFGLPDLVRIDDVSLRGLDAVFLCLPHATTQKVAMRLRSAAALASALLTWSVRCVRVSDMDRGCTTVAWDGATSSIERMTHKFLVQRTFD